MSKTNGATVLEGPQHLTVEAAIDLKRLQRGVVDIPIVGITPLIVHRFDEKAKRIMLEAQQGKKKAGKEPKDPAQDYERSRYRLDDERDGFPAVAFKAAIVGAARHFDKLPMTLLKQTLFIAGEGIDQLVPIDGEAMMREDTVRVGGGAADLRYRAVYWPWSAMLRVSFVASTLTVETVYALVDAAGLGGIGEWRPSAPKSSTGTYGQFQIGG